MAPTAIQVQPVVMPPTPVRLLSTASASSPGPLSNNKQEPGFYVHPHVMPASDPFKGRMLKASAPIAAGTVILVDSPYATVPLRTTGSSSSSTDSKPRLLCSNLSCSRRIVLEERSLACPRKCDHDVVWCDIACRKADQARHDYECLWLRRKGQAIRQRETSYDFSTLWHVVRLLARWDHEVRMRGDLPPTPSHMQQVQQQDNTLGVKFSWGWEAVLMCCDYLDSWPQSQIDHWRRLATAYMDDKSVLPCPLDAEQMISLICKEETNTFGLYERATGQSHAHGSVSRGEAYGMSLYPRAAMFNHSCEPNVSHKPDDGGRMVYTTTRGIEKGEECMITYFDLASHEDVSSRQRHVQEQFRFRCTCDRCVEDETRENLEGTDALPFCSL